MYTYIKYIHIFIHDEKINGDDVDKRGPSYTVDRKVAPVKCSALAWRIQSELNK